MQQGDRWKPTACTGSGTTCTGPAACRAGARRSWSSATPKAVKELAAEHGWFIDGIAIREVDNCVYYAVVPVGGKARKAPPNFLVPLLLRLVPEMRRRRRPAPRRQRHRATGRRPSTSGSRPRDRSCSTTPITSSPSTSTSSTTASLADLAAGRGRSRRCVHEGALPLPRRGHRRHLDARPRADGRARVHHRRVRRAAHRALGRDDRTGGVAAGDRRSRGRRRWRRPAARGRSTSTRCGPSTRRWPRPSTTTWPRGAGGPSATRSPTRPSPSGRTGCWPRSRPSSTGARTRASGERAHAAPRAAVEAQGTGCARRHAQTRRRIALAQKAAPLRGGQRDGDGRPAGGSRAPHRARGRPPACRREGCSTTPTTSSTSRSARPSPR